MMERLGDRAGVARTLGNLGVTHSNLGEEAKALEHHEQAMRLMEQLGLRAEVADALRRIGNLHATTGDWRKAQVHLAKSLRLNAASVKVVVA